MEDKNQLQLHQTWGPATFKTTEFYHFHPYPNLMVYNVIITLITHARRSQGKPGRAEFGQGKSSQGKLSQTRPRRGRLT
jgi:hypothetical protein